MDGVRKLSTRELPTRIWLPRPEAYKQQLGTKTAQISKTRKDPPNKESSGPLLQVLVVEDQEDCL